MSTRRVITIDCETDPFDRGRMVRPFIWGAFDGAEYREFAETGECAAWIAKQDAVVYAHNGGKFDYLFLLDYATRGSPVTLIQGRLSKWYLGLAEMRDSFNIFPLPLRAYRKDDFDYRKLSACRRQYYMPEIRRYLRHDCEFLHELVTRFRLEHSVKLTIASASMDVWQGMRGRRAEHSSARFFDRWKAFYFGGRVEARMRGVVRGPWYLADVVSAYPSAMRFEHPCGFEYRSVRGAVRGGDFVIVECDSYGAFAVRDSKGISFPHGRGVFYATGWEYLAACECEALRHATILKHYRFKNSENFADFVNEFSTERIAAKHAGDTGRSTFLKLLENSLYGKFAADPRNYRENVLMESSEGFAGAGWVGKWTIVDTGPAKHSHFYNVVRAASITGYQRAVMLRALFAVREPIYCDTDSIVCREPLGLEIGNALGEWELDKRTFRRAAIAGKKLYALFADDGSIKTASKGVQLTAKEIERVARGATIEYTRPAPSLSVKMGFRTIVRNVRATI